MSAPRRARGLTVDPYAHPFMRTITARMIETNTTLSTLAQRSGLDETTILAWAQGKQQPTMLYFGWVATVLGLELRLCYPAPPPPRRRKKKS